ncbi:hypothetical protein THAOC_18104, partial [Thalassiosira oceanica]
MAHRAVRRGLRPAHRPRRDRNGQHHPRRGRAVPGQDRGGKPTRGDGRGQRCEGRGCRRCWGKRAETAPHQRRPPRRAVVPAGVAARGPVRRELAGLRPTVLDSGNFVTTLIFLVDMVISNVAMGVAYWRNGSTAFDGVIAISSALELLLARISAGGGQGKSVMSAFRSFRLVRLLRMVKNWKSIHSLLDTISRASSDIRSFAVLLSLLIFVFALMGMQVGARFPSVTLLVNYPPAVCEPASLRRCERASRGHLGPALRRRGRAPVELRRLHVEPGDRLPGAERRELEHGSVRLLEDVESGAGLLR